MNTQYEGEINIANECASDTQPFWLFVTLVNNSGSQTERGYRCSSGFTYHVPTN
jgi:hypothetical protein